MWGKKENDQYFLFFRSTSFVFHLERKKKKKKEAKKKKKKKLDAPPPKSTTSTVSSLGAPGLRPYPRAAATGSLTSRTVSSPAALAASSVAARASFEKYAGTETTALVGLFPSK